MQQAVSYHSIKVDGLSVFYREAGVRGAPALLLLHGLPSSSRMLQKTQPRLLVIWGKYDPSFDISEPEAYRRDVPNASVHVLEAGHFALDTKADEVAALIRNFAA
jgi:pimeloyl-ACP methyl ester carboxylesterase